MDNKIKRIFACVLMEEKECMVSYDNQMLLVGGKKYINDDLLADAQFIADDSNTRIELREYVLKDVIKTFIPRALH